MSHLSRYLEEHNVLYPEQLAEATRRQQIYGGSLDTVLLELELIKPDALGGLLEKACGFPAAPPNLLVGRHNRPWDQIPEDLQRSRWVEPLAMDADEVIVAVHPDLPNDLLGGLLRNVRRMRPMVTPECCLEKVAAERHGSVVPQRYAILSAAYLASVRRPPVVRTPTAESADQSVAGSIDVHEQSPVDAPSGAPPSVDGGRGRRTTMIAAAPPVTPRGTLVSTEAPHPDSQPEPAAPAPAVAEPAAEPRPTPSSANEPTSTHETLGPDEELVSPFYQPDNAVADVPPVTEPTEVLPEPPPPGPASAPERSENDVLRRLERAQTQLSETQSRDAAITALVRAAMVLSPRAGLFRVRGLELVGLSSPDSHLTDIGGTTLGINEGSAAAAVLRDGSVVGPADDPDLVLATACTKGTPCALQRVDVRGRPVLVVYLDRDGLPIESLDTDGLAQLAAAAGQVFEDIVKRRRAVTGPQAGPPQGAVEPTVPPVPPAGTTDAGRDWGPVSPRVRAAYGDGQSGAEPVAVEPTSTAKVVTSPAGPGLPPSVVPPPVDEPDHGDWRLTPQLAAQALLRSEPSGPQPSATTGIPEDDDDAEFEPPATLGEGIPVRALSHDVSGPQRIDTLADDDSASSDASTEEPRATLEDEALPAPPSSTDVTEVAAQSADDPHIPSSRPTMEMAAIGIPADDDDDDDEPSEGATTEGTDDPEDEDVSGTSRPTMVLEPPPPPLPPPPPSAVDESETGARRRRGSTISGLPPPELGGRSGATKRRVTVVEDELPSGDEDVEIIPLARPITPTTARGRIELEEEDWMPTGAPLANDTAQAEIDAIIDRVLAGDADVDALEPHGNAGRLRLMAQFPGHLEVMRRDLRSLPPPSAHGPLIRTVIALGSDIVPHLVDLFEHPNPDTRFYAAFVFHELRDPACMRPLAKLAFDGNGDVRVVSMRVLETYRRHKGFDDAAAIVREQLDSDTRGRQLHAARAAGTLRDIGSIPDLIELLASGDRFIQEASLESLCSITGQQHGLKPHRWRGWYNDQGHMHRVEWIIDSLRHRDLPVRRWAADELVRITGHRVPFSPMGDRRAREVAAKAWTEWWNARGREMFGVED